MKYRILAIAALFLSLPLLAEAQTKPQITESQAEQAALASVKGGKILSGEYEMEGGKHVWSFDVRTSGTIKEVWVDPVSGMVIKVKNESAAHEKSEASKESKKMPESQKMTPKSQKRMPKTQKMMPKSQKMSKHNSMMAHGISKLAAEKLAVKAVHGGKVLKAEKVRREKILVWSVDVKTPKGEKDVWISPENGKVLHVSSAAGSKMMKKN